MTSNLGLQILLVSYGFSGTLKLVFVSKMNLKIFDKISLQLEYKRTNLSLHKLNFNYSKTVCYHEI